MKKQAKDKKKVEKMQQKSFAKWQQSASQLREEQIQEDIQKEIQEGMDILEQEEKLLTEAKNITEANQVVTNVKSEDIEKYGCTSYHQTVLIEEAKRAVEESGGFLYYKEVKPGIAELRPTLPETIEIGNEKKKIPLRRTYNILISKLAQSIVDENGKLLPNAMEMANRLYEALRSIGKQDENKEKRKIDIAALEEAGIDAETISYIELYNKQNMEGVSYTFLPCEILEDFTSMVSKISRLGEISEEGIKKKQEEFEQDMVKENAGEELTKQQKKQIEAIRNMYEDAYIALQEMAKLRNLDPDSKDVALPNACSANAIFQERNRVWAGKNHEKRVEYRTESHLNQNPKMYAQFIIDNFEWLGERFTEKQKTLYLTKIKEAKEIVEKIEKGEVISAEEEEKLQEAKLKMRTVLGGEKSPIKYDYHQLGVVGVIGKDEDYITYTIETFAAETKQYVVSPFTQKVAIGRYKGKANENSGELPSQHQSVDAYYNWDNPLVNEEERILAEVKTRILKKNNVGYSEKGYAV